jgi:dihydroorotase
VDTITLTKPDDWHIHLRDGAALTTTVAHAAAQFSRAIVMPNLKPPVTTVVAGQAYRERILRARPNNSQFEPLMTLYLTDNTRPDEIHNAKSCGFIHGVKLYPAGATTNSDAGVTDLARVYNVLAAMEEVDLPLLVHGEVTRADIDIFDREKVFIDEQLAPLTERFPKLRIVFEHITTKDAAQFVLYSSDRIGATITAHHLLLNRNDMLVGGIRPHYYCLPVLKREEHRRALLDAVASGNPKFFIGTDSAPHAKPTKEAACGCAGVYSAHAAIELYAEAFEQVGALGHLNAFTSLHGPRFYGLSPNQEKITLIRHNWNIPESFTFGDDVVVPLRAGGKVSWRIQNQG